MLKDNYTALLLQVGVVEDLVQLSVLNGKVESVDQLLVDVLDRLTLTYVHEVSTILTSLEVVLRCKPDRLSNGLHSTDAFRPIDDQYLRHVL